MRKKTFRLVAQCPGSETTVTLYTPAEDIADAVKEFKKSSEFFERKLRSVREVEGIVLWKGKTQ
jgi:hypothetical protein